MTLEAVDAELAAWRDRLAAAGRNVAELSELPEYTVTVRAASGTGRFAEEAQKLKATMDELWQGVLLIGGVLDRAERARQQAGRLWGGDAAAAEAMALLHGPSITVDLAETPVLHRRLLAGARATATVPPGTLLQTMDQAFDRARERLTRLTGAAARVSALRAQLGVPGTEGDTLDQLDALEALAVQAAETQALRTALDTAGQALAALQARAAGPALTAYRAGFAGPPAPDLGELSDWWERLRHTLRPDAARKGLANWQALHDRLAAELAAQERAAASATARQDELEARLALLRIKHHARPRPALDPLEAAAKAALTRRPLDLEAAARALAEYAGGIAK